MFLVSGVAPPPMFPVPPEKPDSPRTPRTPEMIAVEERKGSADNGGILSSKVTQESLENTFNYFKRAIVSENHHSYFTFNKVCKVVLSSFPSINQSTNTTID